MKSSSGRRVIKSQDVKFVKAADMTSTTGHDQGKQPSPAGGGTPSLSTERMQELFAKKFQKAVLESYDKGMADGIGKGRELQKNETIHALQSMSAVVKEVSAFKENILATIEKQILALSLAVAKKVIHAEVTTNSEVVQNILRDAIRNIVDRDNMKIRLNTHDFRRMMEIKSDFLQNFDGVKNVVFEEDETIPRGGATIETMFGEVDARIEQQYREIESALTSSDACGS